MRKVSHEDARHKSFVVSLSSYVDYEKLMSGEHIPKNVYVRRYFPPRNSGVSGAKPPWSSQMEELDALSNISDLQVLNSQLTEQMQTPHDPLLQNSTQLTEQMQTSHVPLMQNSSGTGTDHSINTLITVPVQESIDHVIINTTD